MAEGRSVTSNDEMHWSVVRGEGEEEQAGPEQEPSRDCRLQSIPAALRDSDPLKKNLCFFLQVKDARLCTSLQIKISTA